MDGRAMAVLAVMLALGAQVRGDGGAVRFAGYRGDYRVTVFTSPTPVRAGLVDVSVLVQDADSGQPRPDVPVTVQVHPTCDTVATVTALATTDAATNKLLREARLEMPEPGQWQVAVAVDGSSGPPIAFAVDVDDPPPPWLDLALWIGWPFAAAGFFVAHQWLIRRRRAA